MVLKFINPKKKAAAAVRIGGRGRVPRNAASSSGKGSVGGRTAGPPTNMATAKERGAPRSVPSSSGEGMGEGRSSGSSSIIATAAGGVNPFVDENLYRVLAEVTADCPGDELEGRMESGLIPPGVRVNISMPPLCVERFLGGITGTELTSTGDVRRRLQEV